MNKSDMKWLFVTFLTLVGGIWKIWTIEIKPELIIPAIKLIFTIFWLIAVAIAAYFIVFRGGGKKHGKK